MRRITTASLAILALFGAAATGYLVVSLLDRERPVRADPRGGGRGREPAAPAPGRAVVESPVVAENAPDLRAAPAGTMAGIRPGSREAYDGPEYRAELERDAKRVLEILDGILLEEDPSRRQLLGNEMQGLVRRLGGRLDAATKERLFDLFAKIEPKWKGLVAQVLGSLENDTESAKRLLAIAQEPTADVYTTSAAFQALQQMQPRELLPELVALLGSGTRNEALVVKTIGRIGGEDGAKALLARLAGPIRPETRQSIEATLGESRDPKALEAVVAALDGADAATRRSLVDILSWRRQQAEPYAERLRAILDADPDEEVQRSVLRALGRIGDRASGERLLQVAEGGGPLAPAAVQAIHELNNPETIDALASRWDKMGPSGRAALMNAAQRLAMPTPALFDLAAANLRDGDESLRTNAARLLGRRGRSESVEPLVDFLRRASSQRERTAGFEALLKIESRGAAEAVLAHLDLLPEAVREVYRERCRRILERRQE